MLLYVCVFVCSLELFFYNKKNKNLRANIMKHFFKNLIFYPYSEYESTDLKTYFWRFLQCLWKMPTKWLLKEKSRL